MSDNYNDIINLPHHMSNKRKPMSIKARAAQFAPFAALTGYGDAIKETVKEENTKWNNQNKSKNDSLGAENNDAD